MKNGTILEVLNSRPVDSGDSSRIVGNQHRRKALGRIQVVDVFGSHSAATCLGRLAVRDLQVGDPVRKFRVPRWLLLEPRVEYIYALQTVKFDYRVNQYTTGPKPRLFSSTHHTPEINMSGAGFGGSVALMPWRRVRLGLFGTVAWVYTVDGGYTTTQFDPPGVTTGKYDLHEQNFILYGAFLQAGLRSTRRSDLFVEPFAAAIDWNGIRPEYEAAAGIEPPAGVAGVRLALRFHASDRISFALSPGISRTIGGDWSISTVSIQFAPSLSI
jgi:hypothetical protein